MSGLTGTSTGTVDCVQLCIVQDKQCNGALPADTDIFVSDNAWSQFNRYNSHRFKIHYNLRATNITAVLPISELIEFKNPIVIHFKDTGSTITSVIDNNLVVTIGSFNGVTNLYCSFRIYYEDY